MNVFSTSTHTGKASGTQKSSQFASTTSPSELIKRFRNNAGINKAASNALKNIMQNGDQTKKWTKAYGNVIDFKLPNGLSARFRLDNNTFVGWLGRNVK